MSSTLLIIMVTMLAIPLLIFFIRSTTAFFNMMGYIMILISLIVLTMGFSENLIISIPLIVVGLVFIIISGKFLSKEADKWSREYDQKEEEMRLINESQRSVYDIESKVRVEIEIDGKKKKEKAWFYNDQGKIVVSMALKKFIIYDHIFSFSNLLSITTEELPYTIPTLKSTIITSLSKVFGTNYIEGATFKDYDIRDAKRAERKKIKEDPDPWYFFLTLKNSKTLSIKIEGLRREEANEIYSIFSMIQNNK